MSLADQTHQPAGMTALTTWWNAPRLTEYVRWLHELSFSVYCALMVVVQLDQLESSVFLGRLGYPLYAFYRLLAYLYHRSSFSPRRHVHFLALWFELAVLFLVCLRIVGRFAFGRAFVRRMAGFVAVAWYPLMYLLSSHPTTGRSLALERWSLEAVVLLWVEVVAVLTCVFFYLYRTRFPNAALSICVLVLHFGFWDWLLCGDCILLYHGYQLVGLCASVFWAFYVWLFSVHARSTGLQRVS